MRAVELRPLALDWERLAREGPAWMQFWDENIRGRGADYLREAGGDGGSADPAAGGS